MSKIHAVIATLVVGLSSTAAMADSRLSFHADARATVSFPAVTVATSNGSVIRDHRQPQREEFRPTYRPRPTYERNAFDSLSGRYTSNYGTVTLDQRGNRVTGFYVQKDGVRGTIEGTVTNNGLIQFTWEQGGMARGAYVETQGLGVWRVDRFGRIDGTWGSGTSSTNGGNWTLNLR